MASSVPICDICMTDNITKSASGWCSECEEAICNECERQHRRMGLTTNHTTIHIKDYTKLTSSIAAIKQKCIHHNLKFDFYCLNHNEQCCVSCVVEKHGTCQKLKPLLKVVGSVKSSTAFADLEDRTKDISALIFDLIREKRHNRANFGVQKSQIISEVQNVRAAINNDLLNFEKDLLDKLDNLEKKQNVNIDSFIGKLSEMRKNIDNISGDLERTKQHASNFQAFLEFSPILKKLERDVKELGKLEVKSSSSKKILLKKEKQGQIDVPVSNTLDNIKLTNICSFKTPGEVSNNIHITGIDMFDEGIIVLADYHPSQRRLVIMNQEGEFIKTIQLLNQCYDVAVIDKDTVATTLFFAKKVVIVDVNSSKLERQSVSLSNLTIQFFDISGNSLSTLLTADISIHCSVLNDKLYYTTHNSNAVYSAELNGEVRWKFDCQKSAYPTGITNDAAGNVFVACNDSNQLIVVGKDGENSRVLLTEEDGLHKPIAIHYNRKTNTLLVCNRSGTCLQYKVTK
ncbi:unnamed protein product [Mytilus coruscus]|uniref:B box-type domain-containing protein n=1 Tax=Mytilus coruscus TaxID=42192 RepID=A0A6J8ETF2_MYTCO|nr:unnamed protein product [Mytilus coruscus]